MKKSLLSLLPFAMATTSVLAQSTPPPAGDGSWTKQQLTDNFWSEGSAVADVNKDGKMDVFYGPYWFEGPDYTKRHVVYPDTDRTIVKKADGTTTEIEGFKGAKTEENGYSSNFISATHDLNGDGWMDYIVMGFPGKETLWYENPQGKDQPWVSHVAFDVTDNESPMFVDINGDKQPDLLCMSNKYLGYATYDAKKPTEKWTWHPVTPTLLFHKYTHGIGYGDVNGDGRTDLLELNGWWEQPKSLEGNPVWTFHEQKFGVKGGAQMYVYDVNADGKNDVITSLSAHEYGLAWFEQTADGWKQHLITGTPTEAGETGVVFSQLHAIELADMNADGLLDIVTGKRFWAHGKKGDPEPDAPKVLWWFELKREGGSAKYIPHLIDGDSGIGTQFTVTDINGDKKPDVITGNKSGAYVHIQK